nr:nucleotide-binding alpha-beta plait domain-containing protein [Tanacetum cinerariifolium]
MGDFEWTEVRRKNHSHANNRVNGSMLAKNLGKFRTKEDDVARISTSVFISNIPDSVLAKDLFHACKQYGHVVDSFIPYKRDKK